jgi:starch-binding outer membrane protein, SusD/RagB family
MKKFINLQIILLLAICAIVPSCKKDYGNLNNPTIEAYLNNASKDQLNYLVTGTESGMRNNLAFYLDDVGVIGREMYRYSGADPRYVTDLLGQATSVLDNNTFYITNPWAGRYRAVKNCNVLIESATNGLGLTDAEKSGYIGFAQTIKAYQLLLNLNLTYKNGIRIDVSNPDHLGPFLGYDESLAAIASLLDSAKTELAAATIDFKLSSGFDGFSDAAGLTKFNRALAARVAVYREKWADAIIALNESFFDIDGDFNTGVSHVYSTGSGDQLNNFFLPQNNGGEVRLAHPSFATDIASGDDRILKASLRTTSFSIPNSGLSSDRDVWVYTSSLSPIPIVRNEELILIYAEASIQNSDFVNGVKAINAIRAGHNLGVYAGAVTQPALIDEMLNQRRYSLYCEGHRWIDMRRYDRLDQLPLDRPDDDVWKLFPLPLTEQQD